MMATSYRLLPVDNKQQMDNGGWLPHTSVQQGIGFHSFLGKM